MFIWTLSNTIRKRKTETEKICEKDVFLKRGKVYFEASDEGELSSSAANTSPMK